MLQRKGGECTNVSTFHIGDEDDQGRPESQCIFMTLSYQRIAAVHLQKHKEA
jgi:hypothetical protein